MKDHAFRFVQTVAISGAGAIAALIVTTLLVELWFGRAQYFLAYLIGIAVGLLLAFALFVHRNFVRGDYRTALVRYLAYMALLIPAQTFVVYAATGWLGFDRYLVVMSSVLAATAVINYYAYERIVFGTATPTI